MPDTRGLDPRTAAAIDGLRIETLPYWATFGQEPLRLFFPVAATDLDIVHGLSQQPDGYHIVEADGLIHRRPGPWADKTFAYLRATTAGVRATVLFYTLKGVRNEP